MRIPFKQKMIMAFISLLFSLNCNASDVDSLLIYQIDFGNRFIWRGESYNSSPILQTTFGYEGSKLSIYGIGAYSISPNQYCELDFGIDYKIFKFFKIGIVDYFGFIDSLFVPVDVFNYERISTSHILDAYIIYENPGKVPFNITWSTFVYGADLDQNNNSRYSSYIEVSVPFSKGNVTVSPFLGSAPYKGFYSDKPAIVNLGIKFEKTFMKDSKTSFPSVISFICNPHLQKAFISIIIGLR